MIPQYWDGTSSQFEAGFNKASNAIPQYWTRFKAEETWNFKMLNGRVTMRNRAGSATDHAMQPAEF